MTLEMGKKQFLYVSKHNIFSLTIMSHVAKKSNLGLQGYIGVLID